MKKIIALLLFLSCPAWSQSTAEQVVPGTQVISGGFPKFVPASSSAPLPIAVYDSGNHSGFIYTSNGSGSPATFQAASGGGVSSVTNADGTLTISPTTGAVVASIALAHANTWSGAQTFSSSVIMTGLTTGTNADFLCLGASGQILIQASSCTISKRAFKENIYKLDDSSLDEIMEFKPVQFTMKKQKVNGIAVENPDKNFSKNQIGFIAEDVAEIDPRVTTYEQDGKTPKSWDERKFVALLTKAVQVQQHEIEAISPNTKPVQKNWFGHFMDYLEGTQ